MNVSHPVSRRIGPSVLDLRDRGYPRVRILAALSVLCLLGGCTSAPKLPTAPAPPSHSTRSTSPISPTPSAVDGVPSNPGIDVENIPDAVVRAEPKSPYGNPVSYEIDNRRYYPLEDATGFVESGIASWYGSKFHGRRTSSGEIYDAWKMTAAHKTLPLPSYVSVQDIETGKKIVVRVNDRGPFYPDRIIDLSYAAAVKLGIAKKGTGLVEIRVQTPEDDPPPSRSPDEPTTILASKKGESMVASTATASKPKASKPATGVGAALSAIVSASKAALKSVISPAKAAPKPAPASVSSPRVSTKTAPSPSSSAVIRKEALPPPTAPVAIASATSASAAAAPAASTSAVSASATTVPAAPASAASASATTSPAASASAAAAPAASTSAVSASATTVPAASTSATAAPAASASAIASNPPSPRRSSKQGVSKASTEKPEMAKAAEKIDSSPKEAVRNIFLQIASFRRQSNATRLRDRLIEMSVESVQIKEFRHRGQIYYRVRVGPLPSKGAAMEVADSLESLGLGAPLIVSE